MSLLLDALKRAEADRLAASTPASSAANAPAEAPSKPERPVSAAADATELSLADLAPPPAPSRDAVREPATPLPPQRDGATAMGVSAPPSPTPRTRGTPPSMPEANQAASLRGREQAQTLFAVKAPMAARRELPLIPIMGGVALLLTALGGAYVWYSLTRLSQPAREAFAPRPPTSLPSASATAPVPAVAVGTAPASQPAPSGSGTSAPTPETPRADADPRMPVTVPPPPAQLALVPSAARPATSAVPMPPTPPMLSVPVLASAADSTRAAPPRPTVRPTLRPNRVEPAVAAAYAALGRGDLAAAERGYRAAAAVDAANIDALLGLAYIVGQRGDRAQALQHYSAVLALEPGHSAARAGVAALVTPDRPALAQEEPALRAELERLGGSAPNPLAAPLHSALGGVLAGEGRWNEAQAAYYEAFRADAENPDTLYNLAVSLDQLKQPKLAADFYTRALAAAKVRPAQFDAAAASRRLAEIK